MGDLTVADPDNPGEPFGQHTLVVDDGRFEIVGGELRLKSVPTLNHEVEDSVTLTVTATDGGGLSIARLFVISVIDVNEPPTAILLSNNTVAEDADGALVGVVTVDDADNPNEPFGQHTYIVSDPRFEVVSVGGQAQLRLIASQSVNFEDESQITLSIRATDSAGASIEQVFVIDVDDRAETMFVDAPGGMIRLVRSVNAATGRELLRAVDSAGMDVEPPHQYVNVTDVLVRGSGADDQLMIDATASSPIAPPGGIRFEGDAGNDTLLGPDLASSQWVLNGDNQGVLNGTITFVSVENVTGGAGFDRFVLQAGRLDGELTDSAGELRKTTAGVFILNDAQLAASLISVNAGTLQVDGTVVSGDVSVANGATISGVGRIEASGLTLQDGAIYTFAGPDYLEFDVVGQVGPATGSASRPVLVLDSVVGLGPSDELTLIANDGNDPSNIRFVDSGGQLLEEGAIVGNVDGANIYISYLGGDGNDVVLVVEGPVTFTFGSATDATLEVVNGYLELNVGGSVVQRRLAVATTDILVCGSTSEGGPSDNLLILRYDSFPRMIPLTFDGKSGTNRLELRTGPLDTLYDEIQNGSSGNIDLNREDGLDEFEIGYVNVSEVHLAPSSTQHLVLAIAAEGAESLLSDDPSGLPNTSQLQSTEGQYTTTIFTHPADSLTILADSGSLQIGDLNTTAEPLGADLFVNRLSSDSSNLDVTFSAELTSTRDVQVAAANVAVNAPLNANRIAFYAWERATFQATATATTAVSINAPTVQDNTPVGEAAVSTPRLAILSSNAIGSEASPFKTRDLAVLAAETDSGQIVLSNQRVLRSESFVVGPVMLYGADPETPPLTLSRLRVGPEGGSNTDIATSAEPRIQLSAPSPSQFPLVASSRDDVDLEIPDGSLIKPLLVEGVVNVVASLGDEGGVGYSYEVDWCPDGDCDESIFDEGGPTEGGTFDSRLMNMEFTREFLGNPNMDDTEAPIPVEITVSLPDSIILIDANTNDRLSENTIRLLFEPVSFAPPIVQIAATNAAPPPRIISPPLESASNLQNNSIRRQNNSEDFSSAPSSSGAAATRRFVLRVMIGTGPDAREVELDVELPSKLLNLKILFSQLPDDHYRLYLEEGNTRRLIKDFILKDHRELDQEETELLEDEEEAPGAATEQEKEGEAAPTEAAPDRSSAV